MKRFLLSLGFLLIFLCGKAQTLFKVELVNQPSDKEINIKTTFINNSSKPVRLPEYRSIDYVRERILPIGTYIIEFQKYIEGSFTLLTPTADIDASPARKFILLKKGESISDTLNIRSTIFRTQNKSDYSPGKYRIRIAFNTNGWRDKKSGFTKWIEFTID